jgi:hypothetical protein
MSPGGHETHHLTLQIGSQAVPPAVELG